MQRANEGIDRVEDSFVLDVQQSGGDDRAVHRTRRRRVRPLLFNQIGPQGKQGIQGVQGIQGIAGVRGIQGPAGPFPSSLPAGETITGTFAISGGAQSPSSGSDWGETAISFPYPLATAPAAHYLAIGSAPTAACPGTAANPAAAPGNLCVYEGVQDGTATPDICDPTMNKGNACTPDQASRFGAIVRVFESATLRWVHGGTWAVTG